ALEEDPGAVERLFTSADPEGIAVRLEKYLEEVTRASASTRPDPSDGAISSKQKMLALTAADIDEQISRWEERLAMKEEQLRRQFTALEEMLGVLQNQAAWLAGQIASLEALSGAAARSRGTATR
ncbi:MAG: flagellar filament capping protein FliD, partial [Clostridia bacterium]|nr:flagellar filament capping protein FliD [Clostridia bacterium]